MRERTITISGASKTYAATGWRIGYCVAPPALASAIRKVHDFLTVGAPAPLQEAVATAMRFEADYYTELARAYQDRRDLLIGCLEAAGFRCSVPRGAYYVMADISALGFADDRECARWLVEHARVAAVPGSSFYHQADSGRHLVRFAFPSGRPPWPRRAGGWPQPLRPGAERRRGWGAGYDAGPGCPSSCCWPASPASTSCATACPAWMIRTRRDCCKPSTATPAGAATGSPTIGRWKRTSTARSRSSRWRRTAPFWGDWLPGYRLTAWVPDPGVAWQPG